MRLGSIIIVVRSPLLLLRILVKNEYKSMGKVESGCEM